jgi:hypothetical protein
MNKRPGCHNSEKLQKPQKNMNKRPAGDDKEAQPCYKKPYLVRERIAEYMQQRRLADEELIKFFYPAVRELINQYVGAPVFGMDQLDPHKTDWLQMDNESYKNCFDKLY